VFGCGRCLVVGCLCLCGFVRCCVFLLSIVLFRLCLVGFLVFGFGVWLGFGWCVGCGVCLCIFVRCRFVCLWLFLLCVMFQFSAVMSPMLVAIRL